MEVVSDRASSPCCASRVAEASKRQLTVTVSAAALMRDVLGCMPGGTPEGMGSRQSVFDTANSSQI